MDFRILGPLEVDQEGRELPLGGRQQRALLALLLLRANEVVRVDEIIDELWPEAPPPSATRSVHALVSRLRRLLEGGQADARDGDEDDTGVLLARAHGYLLRVAPGELDLHRFQSLLDEGRDALAAGQADVAARTLREALAIWRGPPLAEFASNSFAMAEIARLNELRLSALEERIEADLAAGRSSELVAELEALVAAQPLRERLRGQLMLALYRCGRQAEALQLYQDTRRLLVGELGIEPSQALQRLEQAILRQEEALGLPVRAAPDRARSVRRRLALGGFVVLLAAAAVLAALLATRREPAPAVPVLGNSLAIIDPSSNKVVGSVPNVGARPASVAYGSGSLWVANLDDDTVARVDPRTRAIVKRIPVKATQTALAAGPAGVWISNGVTDTLSHIDTRFNSLARTIVVTRPVTALVPAFPLAAVAVGRGAVWVASSDGRVSRIDPVRNRVVGTFEVGFNSRAIAVGAGAVWVANGGGGLVSGSVTRIDPTGATSTGPVGHSPSAIATGAGAVWVAASGDDTVLRINPDTSAVTATIAVGKNPTALAVGGGRVWVANSGDGTVSRIDPDTNTMKTIQVGASPAGLAFAAGSLWISVQTSAPGSVGAGQGGTAQLLLGGTGDFDYTDPALAYLFDSWQLEYATCAKLVNYPDKPAPAGTQLVPEVAKTLPLISNGGKTYTFTIRKGFRFSPPSNEPVTAQSFKYAIERSLNPKMKSPALTASYGPGGGSYLNDVVGEQAYAAGKTPHIAGVIAQGDTLTIRLTRPDGDLPARLTMPFFCAIPVGTPLDPKGLPEIPSAGPYYIASYTPKQQIVLKRNPNYQGARPRHFEQIVYTIDGSAERSAAQVSEGRADYYPVASLSPAKLATLAARYGPGSAAARAGRQQLYVSSQLAVSFLVLNTSRPLFADVNLRRAVNYAIDRRALIRSGLCCDKPTDQYLPPSSPGYRDAHIYALDHPDLAKARRLAAGRGGHAVMLSCDFPGCAQQAQIVKDDLQAIGIDVEVKKTSFGVAVETVSTRGGAWDIWQSSWIVDYADPAAFLDPLFNGSHLKAKDNNDTSYLDDPSFNRRLERAAKLTGPERSRVYGQLDVDLARDAAPLVALATGAVRDVFSARMGCQVFQPVYGMDLGALCIRQKK